MYLAMLALLCGGFVGGWNAGDRLDAALSARFAPHPDGAPANAFWMNSYVDMPGLEVADLHCRGTVRLIVQLGETGPDTSCGEPQRPRPGSSTVAFECDTYLPIGMVFRRVSLNGGPWRYELARDCLSGIALPPPARRS